MVGFLRRVRGLLLLLLLALWLPFAARRQPLLAFYAGAMVGELAVCSLVECRGPDVDNE